MGLNGTLMERMLGKGNGSPAPVGGYMKGAIWGRSDL